MHSLPCTTCPSPFPIGTLRTCVYRRQLSSDGRQAEGCKRHRQYREQFRAWVGQSRHLSSTSCSLCPRHHRLRKTLFGRSVQPQFGKLCFEWPLLTLRPISAAEQRSLVLSVFLPLSLFSFALSTIVSSIAVCSKLFLCRRRIFFPLSPPSRFWFLLWSNLQFRRVSVPWGNTKLRSCLWCLRAFCPLDIAR